MDGEGPDRELPELPDCARTIARLGRQLELALQPLELTLTQYRVLGALTGGAEAARSLAEKLAVKAPTISSVVDGMVARGLVDRRQEVAGDRRRVAVSLTARGDELAARARAAASERLAGLVAQLGDEHADVALRGLELWGQALDAERDERLQRDRRAGPARAGS